MKSKRKRRPDPSDDMADTLAEHMAQALDVWLSAYPETSPEEVFLSLDDLMDAVERAADPFLSQSSYAH